MAPSYYTFSSTSLGRKAGMRVRTPIYLMLPTLAALALALVPAHASALVNEETGGECVLTDSGYRDNSTGESCNPNGPGGDGGSGLPAEKIPVSSSPSPLHWCGPFSPDDYAERL